MVYDKNIILKEILDIDYNLESIPAYIRGHMHEWYYEMIHKTYKELSIFDVTRMIIQQELLDIALDRAVEYIKDNPLAGQRYDGELLELVYRVDKQYYQKTSRGIKELLVEIDTKINTFDWICEEDYQEYKQLLTDFSRKMNKDE